jgi:hypothetical protein
MVSVAAHDNKIFIRHMFKSVSQLKGINGQRTSVQRLVQGKSFSCSV